MTHKECGAGALKRALKILAAVLYGSQMVSGRRQAPKMSQVWLPD
jgi:hypothetical protein